MGLRGPLGSSPQGSQLHLAHHLCRLLPSRGLDQHVMTLTKKLPDISPGGRSHPYRSWSQSEPPMSSYVAHPLRDHRGRQQRCHLPLHGVPTGTQHRVAGHNVHGALNHVTSTCFCIRIEAPALADTSMAACHALTSTLRPSRWPSGLTTGSQESCTCHTGDGHTMAKKRSKMPTASSATGQRPAVKEVI